MSAPASRYARARFGRALNSLGFDGVGASNDDEILVASRTEGGLQFAEHVFYGNDDGTCEVGAALGVFLVFHEEAREARIFHGADGVGGLQRASVTGVGISEYRNVDGGGDAAGLAYDVLAGQKPDIRKPKCGCGDG